MRCLGETRILSEMAICGPVILQRSYAPVPSGHNSSGIVQAVLHVPQGIGIVRWNSEDLACLQEIPEALEAQACRDFVPFEQCEPVAKALLWPHIEPLVHQLR